MKKFNYLSIASLGLFLGCAPVPAKAAYEFGDITRCVVSNVIKAGGKVACLLKNQTGPKPIDQANRLLALSQLEAHLAELNQKLESMKAQTAAVGSTGDKVAKINAQQRTINEQRERIRATEEAYWD